MLLVRAEKEEMSMIEKTYIVLENPCSVIKKLLAEL